MASSRSPIPQMPFGYSFDPVSNFPYPSPPTPAPGPSLLDDTESDMLGNFFDRVSSATFDNSDYGYDKVVNSSGMGDLPFSWSEPLPPNFHGTTTSLSHPSLVSHGIHEVPQDNRNGHLSISPSYQGPSASEDVLAAATLLQNGHSHQLVAQQLASPESPVFHTPRMGHAYVQQPQSHGSLRRQSSQSFSSQPAHVRLARQSSSSSQPALSPSGVPNGISGTYYPDLLYQNSRRPQSGSPITIQQPAKSVEVRWGSDSSFFEHGYVAPPDQETEEEVTKELLQSMECLVPQRSANNTRPPSPRSMHQHRRGPSSGGFHDMVTSRFATASSSEEDPLGQSTRKRKVTQGEDEEDDGDFDTSEKLKRRKKLALNGKANRSRKTPTVEEMPARQRSQSTGQKPCRENLTEEQKRSNHILSEQKRRNLIKQGFDDLCELVPDLKGGGYSKSAMLVQAADWLEDMLRGNEELRAIRSTLIGVN